MTFLRSLWLFPGQGGQRAGMLTNVDQDLKEKVTNWTGVNLLDTEEGYQNSQQIQLSILLLQIDQVNQMKKLGWKPTLVAGHSLGVFGAAYAAGIIKLKDVFRLVSLRAKLMQDSYPEGYGMGVVVGLSRREVGEIVNQVFSNNEPVYLSNQNSELQNTVSGKLTVIKKVLDLAKKAGASKAILLHVPNPSHSPLMKPVAKKLEKAISKLELRKTDCIYLANYNGHPVKDLDGIKYDLANNLIYPVYWETMINVALEYQPNVSVEFSPGLAFTKLLKAKTNQLSTITLQNMSIDDADFLLNKWKEKDND
ncbi:acyltransferase domain-containing protein [uncultured Lactobacillus sp.]|uniref:ACP S-malonyltransferase n=1 Tax=uncultured Lactobacillus sp. TaxID=153152 RepID=UPI002805EAE6|nr:acyltransferase domain-containing protein [uncultured Lactobacillus sp.]